MITECPDVAVPGEEGEVVRPGGDLHHGVPVSGRELHLDRGLLQLAPGQQPDGAAAVSEGAPHPDLA